MGGDGKQRKNEHQTLETLPEDLTALEFVMVLELEKYVVRARFALVGVFSLARTVRHVFISLTLARPLLRLSTAEVVFRIEHRNITCVVVIYSSQHKLDGKVHRSSVSLLLGFPVQLLGRTIVSENENGRGKRAQLLNAKPLRITSTETWKHFRVPSWRVVVSRPQPTRLQREANHGRAFHGHVRTYLRPFGGRKQHRGVL